MTNHPDQPGSLDWPAHDAGPMPPPGHDRSRATTRRPMPPWDRLKLLVGLAVVFLFLVWNEVIALRAGDLDPDRLAATYGLSDLVATDVVARLEDAALALQLEVGFRLAMASFWWVPALFVLELLRQLHYLASERSASYHRFWTEGVFGGFHRRAGRMNDWNRFRLGRALKWVFWLAILDLVLAAVYDLHPAIAIFQAPVAFFNVLPFFVQIFFYAFILIIQFVALFWFLSRGGVDVYMPEDIETRFDDIWGQDHVLVKVKENMVYLDDPEAIEAKGGFIPGGILLWGPPGTGKTLMAEAVAGETGKPFVFVDPGAFTNMFIGVGILKVKALFRKLRKLALRFGGVIVFFDEADSLGNRGMAVAGQGGWSPQGHAALFGHQGCHGPGYLSTAATSAILRSHLDAATGGGPRGGVVDRVMMGMGMGGGGGMGTLQALLTEISGLKKPRGFVNRHIRRILGMRPKPPPKYRILVMMATNMPQALDPALLRPGRIDRIYKVGYPSKEGRIKTYEGYLAKVRHDLSPTEIERLAVQTPYATGASIKDLVNEALINSIREGRRWITWQDVIRARLLKTLGPPEDVEYIERERHSVAIHEACHAVAAYRVRKHLAIDIATIEKGQDYLGMVASIPLEEQFTQWRTEYEADLVVGLAALVGERMFFEGDNSSGVSADLRNATTLAMLMEGYWGMGETVGSQAATKPVMGTPMNDVSRNLLETELGHRVETLLRRAIERTQRLLEENRREILAVAHALESHKTLTGEDVVAVIEGKQGPLVDGRVYADDRFLTLAEDYHSRALEAHKQHSPVSVPLPRLDGHGEAVGAGSFAWDDGDDGDAR